MNTVYYQLHEKNKNNNTDGIRTSALYGFSYNWLTYIYFNWILQDSKNTNLKYSWKDNK